MLASISSTTAETSFSHTTLEALRLKTYCNRLQSVYAEVSITKVVNGGCVCVLSVLPPYTSPRHSSYHVKQGCMTWQVNHHGLPKGFGTFLATSYEQAYRHAIPRGI